MSLFFGEGFGDGSGLYNNSHYTRRCGSSVVSAVSLVTTSQGHAAVTAFAPLTGQLQEVPLAEAYALLFFLRNLVPKENEEAVFYTDCACVVASVEAGRQQCTHATAVGADTWKKIFDAVEETFGQMQSLLQVKKVRAHTTRAASSGSAELAYLWWGNKVADDYAKEVAKRHPVDTDALKRVVDHSAAATCVAKFLSRAAVWRLKTFGKVALA